MAPASLGAIVMGLFIFREFLWAFFLEKLLGFFLQGSFSPQL
jgi:hypothetical protein